MKPERLPPLTALRSFEAASRHLSFAKAAQELSVTPAALSFQIKSLEDHLGQQVFNRLNRSVELTEAGRLLAPGVQDAFDRLNATWRAVHNLNNQRVITVVVPPEILGRLLAPRLHHFTQTHNDVELRFVATRSANGAAPEGADLMVTFGAPPNFSALPLASFGPEWVVPVMAPSLADRYTTPADLNEADLFLDAALALSGSRPDWKAWFEAAGVGQAPQAETIPGEPMEALDRALRGEGVLLARASLVAADVVSGALVAPFDKMLSTQAQLTVSSLTGQKPRRSAEAFCHWLSEEIAATRTPFQSNSVVSTEQLVRSSSA